MWISKFYVNVHIICEYKIKVDSEIVVYNVLDKRQIRVDIGRHQYVVFATCKIGNNFAALLKCPITKVRQR